MGIAQEGEEGSDAARPRRVPALPPNVATGDVGGGGGGYVADGGVGGGRGRRSRYG